MKRIFFFLSLKLTMMSAFVMGQRPTSIPRDDGPLRLDSLTNIIFYILIPLIIIFIYYLWRRKMKKEEEERQKEKEEKQ